MQQFAGIDLGREQLIGRGACDLRIRGEIEGQVGNARVELPQQGCLTHLPCAGDEHCSKLLYHSTDNRLDLPCNRRADNLQPPCKSCNLLDYHLQDNHLG